MKRKGNKIVSLFYLIAIIFFLLFVIEKLQKPVDLFQKEYPSEGVSSGVMDIYFDTNVSINKIGRDEYEKMWFLEYPHLSEEKDTIIKKSSKNNLCNVMSDIQNSPTYKGGGILDSLDFNKIFDTRVTVCDLYSVNNLKYKFPGLTTEYFCDANTESFGVTLEIEGKSYCVDTSSRSVVNGRHQLSDNLWKCLPDKIQEVQMECSNDDIKEKYNVVTPIYKLLNNLSNETSNFIVRYDNKISDSFDRDGKYKIFDYGLILRQKDYDYNKQDIYYLDIKSGLVSKISNEARAYEHTDIQLFDIGDATVAVFYDNREQSFNRADNRDIKVILFSKNGNKKVIAKYTRDIQNHESVIGFASENKFYFGVVSSKEDVNQYYVVESNGFNIEDENIFYREL